MKLKDLLRDLNVVESTADPELEIRDICYNSRLAQPGDLFVAVCGYQSDGHKYIPMAVERGVAAVLCERKPEQEIPYILVEDSRLALALVSAAYFEHPSEKLTMIGVTGTNGKTTVTTLLKHMLEEAADAKVGLIGTNGNMIGSETFHTEHTTPESYEVQKLLRQMVDAGCTHCVMEVSSHSLVLHRVAGIRYDIGMFLNLTQDHLDFHETMENYAEAKALLYRQSKYVILNRDDQWSDFMLKKVEGPHATFSTEDNHADFVAKDVRLSPEGVRFILVAGASLLRCSLAIPGMFSVYNALAVMAAAAHLGIPGDRAAAALATSKGVKGRAELLQTDGDYTLLIDYAVTPDAVENILNTAREFTRGRLVFLFGCGGDRDKLKRPIMGRIAGEKADFVIVTSDNPRTEDPKAIIEDILPGLKKTRKPYVVRPDRREAIEYAIENHKDGDVIILCGKGHEDYQIIGKEKIHMDEREIVAEILQKRKEQA